MYNIWKTDVQEIFVDWWSELELDGNVKVKGEGKGVSFLSALNSVGRISGGRSFKWEYSEQGKHLKRGQPREVWEHDGTCFVKSK